MSKHQTPPGPTLPASPASPARPKGEAAARKDRSAEALRDNLRRRKEQTAARRAEPSTPEAMPED